MKPTVIALSLILAGVLWACTPEEGTDTGESTPSQEAKKREDPLAGIAGNVGGLRRGSDTGFAGAADATQ